MGDMRKYISDYARNWREYEGPLAKKLALAARNRTRAMASMKGCCGHRGEPGC